MGKKSKKKIKKEKKQNKTGKKLRSSELASTVVMNEYNMTFERSNALATRGGVFLSAFLAAIMISFSNIRFDFVFQPIPGMLCKPTYYLLTLCLILYMLCSLLTLILLIISVTTMTFQGVNCADLDSEKMLASPKSKVAFLITGALHNAVIANDKMNVKKARCYNLGVWLGFVEIVLFVFIQIIQTIMEGACYA